VVSGIGAPNGPSRGGFSGWFRYPAGFSDSAFRLALAAVDLRRDSLVIDPFAGAAVGGALLAECGFRFRGIEANPLIAEMADLKFRKPGPGSDLLELAAELLARSRPHLDEAETKLITASFSVEALGVLSGLRREVANESSDWAPYMKWALLATLREVSTSKVGWPYQRPSVARKPPHTDVGARFLFHATSMATSLDGAQSMNGTVLAGDARQDKSWTGVLAGATADGCVTSPPYLNNYDYADATRLEAYFWGIARSWAELCEVIRLPMMTSTTQQTRVGMSDDAMARLKDLPSSHAIVSGLKERLEAERLRRQRGKEYDRLVGMYFADAMTVTKNLFRHLQPGARAALVVGDSAPYGVYIDTPAIWTSIANEVGFTKLADQTIRSRGQRWRTNGSRHQVALSERIVLWQRPSGD
jgi:hypothetical protein